MAISQSEHDKFPGGRIKYFIHRVKYPYLYEFFSIFLEFFSIFQYFNISFQYFSFHDGKMFSNAICCL